MSFLLANDAISGKEASIWATIGGEVVELAEVKSFTANIAKTKKEFKALGKRGTQSKATGWTGTGTLNFYYVSSRWAKMLIDYAKTGVDTYFNLTAKNEDPSSSIGAQKITLGQCNLDGGDIAKIDVEADFLDHSFNFTFSDVDIPEQFKQYNAQTE